ncbi:unnamed protein product [Prorocentrum cordatum]|uniref:PPIase cyclophilin-type domain-containing protein n=1 Tax=Prorocentrum cordatum TaxID=2364126 RepID=A0ABN9V0K2_9DINO|nr:unnamed protein product [Polarella glacialis]
MARAPLAGGTGNVARALLACALLGALPGSGAERRHRLRQQRRLPAAGHRQPALVRVARGEGVSRHARRGPDSPWDQFKEKMSEIKKAAEQRPKMSSINTMRAELCWSRVNVWEHQECLLFLALRCLKESTGRGICDKFLLGAQDKCAGSHKPAMDEFCGLADRIHLFPEPEGVPAEDDMDGDGIADWKDDDMDGDEVNNEVDDFPDDPTEWSDIDQDGIGDNRDPDRDGDGVPNDRDKFPNDPREWQDTDGDGIGDNKDEDSDGDGVPDSEDAFPDDATEWQDMDGDGVGDNKDLDRDGDGVANTMDAFPSDASEWGDVDGDGIGDNKDLDRDGDGIPNDQDAFPVDPTEWSDLDGDGVGDNKDADRDGDGVPNDSDFFPDDRKKWKDPNLPPDSDGDGVPDYKDPAPNDPRCWEIACMDSDKDGVPDVRDPAPHDPRCWERDCVDSDGDGVPDVKDPAPADPDCWKPECVDSDGDGVPDVKDPAPHQANCWEEACIDSDADGVPDSRDPAPHDRSCWKAECVDSDGDGVPDVKDPSPNDRECWREECVDSDGDGVPDVDDPAPNDAKCWEMSCVPKDSDGDGVMDEDDPSPNDPTCWEEWCAQDLRRDLTHRDGETWTGDWRKEWKGPEQDGPHRNETEEESVARICRDYPESEWCTKYRTKPLFNRESRVPLGLQQSWLAHRLATLAQRQRVILALATGLGPRWPERLGGEGALHVAGAAVLACTALAEGRRTTALGRQGALGPEEEQEAARALSAVWGAFLGHPGAAALLRAPGAWRGGGEPPEIRELRAALAARLAALQAKPAPPPPVAFLAAQDFLPQGLRSLVAAAARFSGVGEYADPGQDRRAPDGAGAAAVDEAPRALPCPKLAPLAEVAPGIGTSSMTEHSKVAPGGAVPGYMCLDHGGSYDVAWTNVQFGGGNSGTVTRWTVTAYEAKCSSGIMPMTLLGTTASGTCRAPTDCRCDICLACTASSADYPSGIPNRNWGATPLVRVIPRALTVFPGWRSADIEYAQAAAAAAAAQRAAASAPAAEACAAAASGGAAAARDQDAGPASEDAAAGGAALRAAGWALSSASWLALLGCGVALVSADGLGFLSLHGVPEPWRAGFRSAALERAVRVEQLLEKYSPAGEGASGAGAILLGPRTGGLVVGALPAGGGVPDYDGGSSGWGRGWGGRGRNHASEERWTCGFADCKCKIAQGRVQQLERRLARDMGELDKVEWWLDEKRKGVRDFNKEFDEADATHKQLVATLNDQVNKPAGPPTANINICDVVGGNLSCTDFDAGDLLQFSHDEYEVEPSDVEAQARQQELAKTSEPEPALPCESWTRSSKEGAPLQVTEQHGDFDMGPQELAECDFAAGTQSRLIFSEAQETCTNNSVEGVRLLDFFVGSSGLAAGAKPHRWLEGTFRFFFSYLRSGQLTQVGLIAQSLLALPIPDRILVYSGLEMRAAPAIPRVLGPPLGAARRCGGAARAAGPRRGGAARAPGRGMTTKVKFEIKGIKDDATKSFVVEVHPEWAPKGAQRFLDLVQDDHFNSGVFYRAIKGFMAQFGIPAEAEQYSKWSSMIKDDPVKESNTRGRLSFAMRGPDTRSCQLFINFGDNSSLDSQGFSPFAEVIEGMDVVDTIFTGYEDAPYREPIKEKGEQRERAVARAACHCCCCSSSSSSVSSPKPPAQIGGSLVQAAACHGPRWGGGCSGRPLASAKRDACRRRGALHEHC